MQENQVQSRFMIILKMIWPYINRVINMVVYFSITLIKNFFKDAFRMIKGI
jgi:hypothetical protein